MNSSLVISLVLILWVSNTFSLPFAGSCDSCGRECQSACGTRGFRTCCLNYLKKRSTPLAHSPAETQTERKREPKLERLLVLPELAEFYSSLGFLLPSDTSDLSRIKILFEKKKESERAENAELD